MPFGYCALRGLEESKRLSAGRGQISPVLQVNSRSIDQKIGEIWTGQADLQPISFKSDRLLDELFGTVLPNMERFPLIGRDFMARQPRAVEGINLHEALLGALQIREFVHGDYLLLYALSEEKLYLLAIKHHRQLSFDLNAFWF